MQTILDLPYRSQRDAVTAGRWANDCGPACVSMMLAATGVEATPNELYARTGVVKDTGLSTVVLREVSQQYGLVLERYDYSMMANPLDDMRMWLDQGKPALILLDYGPIVRAGLHETPIVGGHFINIVGYDDSNLYVHDPYWKGEGGAFLRWRNEVVLEAWFKPYTQYINVTLIPDHPICAVTDPPFQVPDHVQRLLRAKASYKGSNVPHVRSEEDYQAALDWLGDWGKDVVVHTIAPGESLGVVAERYFGSGQYYTTIAVYNNIRDPRRVEVGQQLEIPLPNPTVVVSQPGGGQLAEKAPRTAVVDSQPHPAEEAHPVTQPGERTVHSASVLGGPAGDDDGDADTGGRGLRPDEIAPHPSIPQPVAPTPAPATPPADRAAMTFRFTNQQMINAFYAVYSAKGETATFWEHVEQAGLDYIAQQRSARYEGPHPDDMPNLPDDVKAALKQQLGL